MDKTEDYLIHLTFHITPQGLPRWPQWQRIHLLIQEKQEVQVPSQGWGDSLENEVATHSSILAWRIPWTKEPEATVHGVTKSKTWLSNRAHTHITPWRTPFLCLYQQHKARLFPSEKAKPPRQEKFLTTRSARKPEVASICLCICSSLTRSQQFIMSPLGKTPNGDETVRGPISSSQRAASEIALLTWLNSCESPLPQPPGEGERSFRNVFLPHGSLHYAWGQTQGTANHCGIEGQGSCRKENRNFTCLLLVMVSLNW